MPELRNCLSATAAHSSSRYISRPFSGFSALSQPVNSSFCPFSSSKNKSINTVSNNNTHSNNTINNNKKCPSSAPSTRSSRLSYSNRSSAYHDGTSQRKRTLDEFPMDHSRVDATSLYARRRRELEEQRLSLASTCGESEQLKSYSRKRFETALTFGSDTGSGHGKSLPPPSPEENRIFWEERQPTWMTQRRHHSLAPGMSQQSDSEACRLSQNVSTLASKRPVSEPTAAISSRQQKSHSLGGRVRGSGADGLVKFNHLRGNNAMYPNIKKLLKESNEEYKVVCGSGDNHIPRQNSHDQHHPSSPTPTPYRQNQGSPYPNPHQYHDHSLLYNQEHQYQRHRQQQPPPYDEKVDNLMPGSLASPDHFPFTNLTNCLIVPRQKEEEERQRLFAKDKYSARHPKPQILEPELLLEIEMLAAVESSSEHEDAAEEFAEQVGETR